MKCRLLRRGHSACEDYLGFYTRLRSAKLRGYRIS
uniref:Uncharacterized protein n=1 Tax=Anguilla anguilla TaxID=7936 RepID=A0A0E9UCS9_ANGAN